VPHMGKATLPATLQDLARVMPVCSGVRSHGAAALDLAYVAAGRFDGYWERGLKPWDMAAGLLLVKEAGGFVGPVREGRDMLESGSVIAANGELFAPLCKILREAA
jgi:myo-inositol-1(or 4)-monophosphatase